jgi:S1-C subfamily serine protease
MKSLSEGSRVRLLWNFAVEARKSSAMLGLLIVVLAAPPDTVAAEVARYQPTQSPVSHEGRQDSSPTVSNIAKQVYRLIVETDEVTRGGSAFLVSGNRVVATNHHVVDKGTVFTLGYVTERGGVERVRLHLLAAFPQKDLALLEAAEDLPGDALPLAADYPELASDLYAIGFPAAADLRTHGKATLTDDQNFFLPSVLRGTVSRIMTGHWLTNQIQHQTPISPGYSGGPLVDSAGNVVGVSTAINREANGISYGVASLDVARLLTACALPLRTSRFVAQHITTDASPANAIPKEDWRDSLPGADAALMQRALEMMRKGDIAGARIALDYLASRNEHPSVFQALAKTYDPVVLKQLKVLGFQADAEKAKELYDKASQLDTDNTLPGVWGPTSCRNSLCTMLEGSEGAPLVVCSAAQ